MRRWSEGPLLVLFRVVYHVSPYHACAFITFSKLWKIVIINCSEALCLLIMSSVSFPCLFLLVFLLVVDCMSYLSPLHA